MHLTLRQMETFLTVADTGSFTRAADVLSLSPSAVSQLIHEMEAVLGYKVFDRNTRRVVLSAAGRALLPSVKALSRQLAQTRALALDIRHQSAGLVRIAAPQVVASVILPRLMAQYSQQQPKVVLRLIDCAVDDLPDKVADRDVDLALGPERPVGPDVECIALYASPWVVWCAPDHPFARMPILTWRDLASRRLVVAGQDHESQLHSIFQQHEPSARPVPEQVVDNISSALGMAAAGLCYTLSPAYVQALARPLGLVMRYIEQPRIARAMSLYRLADQALSPAAAGFSEHIVRTLTQEVGFPHG